MISSISGSLKALSLLHRVNMINPKRSQWQKMLKEVYALPNKGTLADKITLPKSTSLVPLFQSTVAQR